MTHNDSEAKYVTNVSKRLTEDRYKLTLLLVFIFSLIAIDVSLDLVSSPSKTANRELVFEVLLECIILGAVGYTVFFIWKRFSNEKSTRRIIEQDLLNSKAEAKAWKEQSRGFAKGFRADLEKRFQAWGLSNSEKEISLLLIMGKPTKEIAKIRFTSDRTIRNQCKSIYEKSQCKGRNELAAYFLAPLFQPK